MRLFCGLRLPPEAVERIECWQARELRQATEARCVSGDHLHVTLAFLGRRPRLEVPAIAGALADAVADSAAIVLSPQTYRETRSVGMLVCADWGGRATTLAARLEARLAELGVYRPEDRPWLPHVTVLRFRRKPGLQPLVVDLGDLSPSDAALYHSVLRSTGAQYEVLKSVALGG